MSNPEEKNEERLAMESEAAKLGIKGKIAAMKDATLSSNIAAMKDATLSSKIAEAKDPKAVAAAKTAREKAAAKKKSTDICVGVNACKGKFGIAGKVFEPGEDVVIPKIAMENRNTSARVTHAKKLGMIK